PPPRRSSDLGRRSWFFTRNSSSKSSRALAKSSSASSTSDNRSSAPHFGHTHQPGPRSSNSFHSCSCARQRPQTTRSPLNGPSARPSHPLPHLQRRQYQYHLVSG